MKVKEIIDLNNEKRKKLTEENLVHYEDMLTYIRLASNKSEQQTEEILLELLDHTLDAQEEGRTVKEVFGNDLKHYCQELIEEIPRETFKKQTIFSFYITLLFLTMASLTNGVFGFIASFISADLGQHTFTIGWAIVVTLLDILIAFLFIYGLLKWMKESAFKEVKSNKWVEFFQIWLGFMLTFGLFFLIAYLIPEFGPTITIKAPWFIVIAAGLYLLSRWFKR